MHFGKFKKRYDFIMPVGQGCVVPQVLGDVNLRIKAGPFDWTFVDDYNVTMDILKNKFENYFNKEDLEFVSVDTLNRADTYKNKKNRVSHVHSFPPNSRLNFDINYELANKIYTRRINRFFEYIVNKYKICLVFVEYAPDWLIPEECLSPQVKVANKSLEEDIKELNKIYGYKCFDIFYIKHNPQMRIDEFKVDKKICYMNNSAENVNFPWRGNFTLLQHIISNQMELSTRSKFEQIKNKIRTTKLILKLIYT